MKTDIEALELAICVFNDVLGDLDGYSEDSALTDAIIAARDGLLALKMPDAEPCGWVDAFGNYEKHLGDWMVEETGWMPVYANPQSAPNAVAYQIFGINADGRHYIHDVLVITNDEWQRDDGGLEDRWAGNNPLYPTPQLTSTEIEWKQKAQENELMAGCMDMLRTDLIDVGIIDKSVPPMMLTEAIMHAIQLAKELPTEASAEANDAIREMLKEYNYPSNPQNAGRAGWRAARLYGVSLGPKQKNIS